jgi:hypothetical protein
MSRILLNNDELNGIKQYHDYDEDTDTSRFISVGDAEPVIEFNKKVSREFDIDKGIKDGWWWYAHLPMIFLLECYTKHGIKYWEKGAGPALSRILEDPAYSHLKMTTKKHIIKSYD